MWHVLSFGKEVGNPHLADLEEEVEIWGGVPRGGEDLGDEKVMTEVGHY